MDEINDCVEKNECVLIIILMKKMLEDLINYFKEVGVKV